EKSSIFTQLIGIFDHANSRKHAAGMFSRLHTGRRGWVIGAIQRSCPPSSVRNRLGMAMAAEAAAKPLLPCMAIVGNCPGGAYLAHLLMQRYAARPASGATRHGTLRYSC